MRKAIRENLRTLIIDSPRVAFAAAGLGLDQEIVMRMLVLTLALATAMAGLAACTTANPNSRVYQTINNQPNACGPGFKRNIDAC